MLFYRNERDELTFRFLMALFEDNGWKLEDVHNLTMYELVNMRNLQLRRNFGPATSFLGDFSDVQKDLLELYAKSIRPKWLSKE